MSVGLENMAAGIKFNIKDKFSHLLTMLISLLVHSITGGLAFRHIFQISYQRQQPKQPLLV